MPGRTATALLVVIVAASCCGSAMAQQEVIDNVILLGDIEALYVPGVRRVEERPEEKTPPEPFQGTIENDPFHWPVTTRFHPGETYWLEENGTRQRLQRGERTRIR